MEEVIPDLHIFDGDIKARKRQGYTPGVETVYYTHTQSHTHKQPYTSPAIHGLSHEPVQTHGPILHLLLWTILFCVTADSQDHVGNKNRWLWLKGRTGLRMYLVAQGLRPPHPVQGGAGSIPGGRTMIPPALKQLSPKSPRALEP